MASLDVRHGTIEDIRGRAASSAGWELVPAAVKLDGSSFTASHHLGQAVASSPPGVLVPWLDGGMDAHWVRARLPRVFLYAPRAAEVEKALLDEGFVATRVEGASRVAYPFLCMDHYGETGLLFSEPGPDAATQDEIAAAFWSLLLREPDSLEDFSEEVFHPGTGMTMVFSCKDGALGFEEHEE